MEKRLYYFVGNSKFKKIYRKQKFFAAHQG